MRPIPRALAVCAAFVYGVLVLSAPVRAVEATLGDACLAAAETAAREAGIPPGLLSAIALAESGTRRGGRFQPWPWTLNVDGEGLRFDGAGAALDHAGQAVRRGARSVDLGCFQINLRWHGTEFRSLGAMLDPDAGARYAARFLRELYAESGSWLMAAGHYHSRTPEKAGRYRARVEALLDQTGPLFRPVSVARGVPPSRTTAPAAVGPLRMPEEGRALSSFLALSRAHGPLIEIAKHSGPGASVSTGGAPRGPGSLFGRAVMRGTPAAALAAGPGEGLFNMTAGPLIGGGS